MAEQGSSQVRSSIFEGIVSKKLSGYTSVYVYHVFIIMRKVYLAFKRNGHLFEEGVYTRI